MRRVVRRRVRRGAPSRRPPLRAVLGAAALAVALTATRAAAVVVAGGGSARIDCLSVFRVDVAPAAVHGRRIRCTDGDPTCDADGLVNGVCEFPVALCANSGFSPMCGLQGVEAITVAHALDNGDPKFDPELQALQQRVHDDVDLPTSAPEQCSGPTSVHVAIRGPFGAGVCKARRREIRVVALSELIAGAEYRDADRLTLRCDPAPDACSARALFTGTFDRIQRQIFNQSCAVSSCHDSQSRTGNLLLETGAAYANLVGVAPSNLDANAAGWRRVDVVDSTSGNPATSLLVQKLLGPPPGFGARMPFGRPRLDQSLIDVVQRWVAAGAPATGWVAGTD